VLVVEDGASDALITLEMLRHHEHPAFVCDRASTLQGAIQQTTVQSFDCVLLDMGLPDSNGLETLDKICREAGEAAVVVLTALDDPATADAAVSRGAQDYLMKGHIDRVLLTDAICNAVERRKFDVTLAKRDTEAQRRVVTSLVDMTDSRALEMRRSTVALHHALTGLVERPLLIDRLKSATSRMKQTGKGTALLCIDLDQLESINDSYGQAVGDSLLVQVAARLRSAVNSQNTLGRLGGDKLVVLCEDVQDGAEALEMAELLTTALTDPFFLPSTTVVVTASIGIAMGHAGMDGEELLRHADCSMYRAKARGGAGLDLYDDPVPATAGDRTRVEVAVRGALDTLALDLDYQPIVDLSSGRSVGLEALLRLVTPQSRLLPPGFIRGAEASGMILPIGSWVLDKACHDVALLQASSGESFKIAVNVSPVQVRRRFRYEVERALEASGLEPASLCLELTESVVLESSASSIAELRSLAKRGVQLALDDFGTGYSSLSYLSSLPVTAIKIDRWFVSRLETDSRTKSIVAFLVGLADALGLDVIGEGIETVRQSEILTQLGCKYGQGYLYSRPVPLSELQATRWDTTP
jgi:diguanylate cyclase (GGDEF)-like protein